MILLCGMHALNTALEPRSLFYKWYQFKGDSGCDTGLVPYFFQAVNVFAFLPIVINLRRSRRGKKIFAGEYKATDVTPACTPSCCLTGVGCDR